jgi:hypothetical protein
MKQFTTLLIALLLFSCKPKQTVATDKPVAIAPNTSISIDKIIENYNAVKIDFKTIHIKSSIAYEDYKQSQNVSADIKIKKDEIIHINVKFLGFPVAKALITPTQVKYYEKVGGKFFEGNFETLSKWLGNDLNFSKLQNLLIGKALDNFGKEKFEMSLDEGNYELKLVNNDLEKLFTIDSNKFLLKKQAYNQPLKNRKLTITYPNFTTFAEAIIPTGVSILALVKQQKLMLNMNQ